MLFIKKNVSKLSIFILLLSSCAMPTPYKAADGTGPGYREQKIDENRFRIVFKGNRLTSRETVELYLLYRAAELTQAKGFDYFSLAEKFIEANVNYETQSPSPYLYGNYSPGFRRFPYYAYGYPWSYTSTKVESSRMYEAVAYIKLLSKKPSENDLFGYNAKAVVKNLEPKIKRSKDK